MKLLNDDRCGLHDGVHGDPRQEDCDPVSAVVQGRKGTSGKLQEDLAVPGYFPPVQSDITRQIQIDRLLALYQIYHKYIIIEDTTAEEEALMHNVMGSD